MDINEMKTLFLESAVHVVARDGLEKATTKAMAKAAGLNEAYIYKCFAGKDELLNEALHREDENFAALLDRMLPVMRDTRFPWKDRAFLLWKQSWDFILQKRDDCVFYIRFYFASIGMSAVYRKHLDSYQPLLDKISPAFRPGTNLIMVLHQLFCTMLFYASRVMDGDLENNETTTRWVFEQIYCFIVPHVRKELLEEEEK